MYNPKFTIYLDSNKIDLHLMGILLVKGCCVTMDNYYVSTISKHFNLYFTVNKNRKTLPLSFAKEKISKGEVLAYQRGKVMALKWQDKKKSVSQMRTVHYASWWDANQTKLYWNQLLFVNTIARWVGLINVTIIVPFANYWTKNSEVFRWKL